MKRDSETQGDYYKGDIMNKTAGKSICGCEIKWLTEEQGYLDKCSMHEAAPALLKACKEALQYCRQIPEYVDRSVHKSIPIATLEDAIAKAEGRN